MAKRRGVRHVEEEIEEQGRGRSKRKREVMVFDGMALDLGELSDEKCRKLPVSDLVKEAIDDVRITKSKSARRRFVRRLAGVLRDNEEEAEAINNFLEGRPFIVITGDEEFRELEELRARLCDASSFEAAVIEMDQSMAYIDVPLIRKLAAVVHAAPDLTESPATKAHRGIFRELRRATDEAIANESVAASDET